MKFSISKQFRYDIQECIPHYYQVTTSCESPSSLSASECDGNCPNPTVTIITVMACSVDEVCRKVKAQFGNVSIDKIIMFTKPAMNRDVQGIQDPTCTIDVTPSPTDCGACCDLIQEESSSLSSSESSSGTNAFADLLLVEKPREFIQALKYKPTTENHVYALAGAHTSNFTYVGSGVINFSGGSAPVEADDAGVLTQNIVFSESISDIGFADLFIPTSIAPLPQTVQTIQLPCCHSPLTLVLEVKHTLNKMVPLADFLKTNNLTLPGVLRVGSSNSDFIKLNYSTRDEQWRGNLHYTGQSSQGPYMESWDIGVTFGCLHHFWQFAITLVNNRPGRRALSRLVLYYLKSVVCPDNASFFGFSFNLDTTLLQSTPATSQRIVLNDDAGFFSNLQLAFRIQAQNLGSGSHQLPVDNTVPYDNSLID